MGCRVDKFTVYHNSTGMKSIHIRQVDEEVLDGLKRRARLHRRSLQKEIEALLEDAARMIPRDKEDASLASSLHIVASGKRTTDWSREDLYADDGR